MSRRCCSLGGIAIKEFCLGFVWVCWKRVKKMVVDLVQKLFTSMVSRKFEGVGGFECECLLLYHCIYPMRLARAVS
jgi:hypothetical protein